MAKREKTPKTVELVKAGYQPTKHEMKDEFSVHKTDGTDPTLEDLAQALLQPVKIRLIDKPRNRRQKGPSS